mgnify:CR=1 FL=1
MPFQTLPALNVRQPNMQNAFAIAMQSKAQREAKEQQAAIKGLRRNAFANPGDADARNALAVEAPNDPAFALMQKWGDNEKAQAKQELEAAGKAMLVLKSTPVEQRGQLLQSMGGAIPGMTPEESMAAAQNDGLLQMGIAKAQKLGDFLAQQNNERDYERGVVENERDYGLEVDKFDETKRNNRFNNNISAQNAATAAANARRAAANASGPQTALGKLIAERNRLPPDHPNLAFYDAALAKATQSKGMRVIVGPDGQMTLEQGVGLGGTPKITEGQSKDINYLRRGRGANEALNGNEAALTGVGDNLANRVPLVGNHLTSDDYKNANRDAQEFLMSLLRKDTGAAITNKEFDLYGPVYLPQPGDGPEQIRRKAEARARALQAMEVGLGPAAILAQEGGGAPQQQPPPRRSSPSDVMRFRQNGPSADTETEDLLKKYGQ